MNTLRIKRRAAGGAAGAPASLENAELAYNEQDDVLYYGKGTGGAGGSATQVIAIGGPGAFQGVNALLSAISALAANGIIVRSGSGAAVARSIVAPAAGITITNGDGVNGNPTLALANDLAALEGLSSTGLIIRTGDGTATTRSIAGTSGRITVTNGDGISGAPTIDLNTSGVTAGTYTKITVDAYGRATVGAQASLSDLAAPTANFDFNAKRITNLADPVSAQDAATKNYVDLQAQGLDPKQSVKAASTANIATLSGTMTIDGVALVAGDRVLVKDQNTVAQNGVYVVAAGAWARADDMSLWSEHVSAYLFVEQGAVNADNGFLCTVDQGGTLGSTAITFVQFNGAGQIVAGAGLTKTGNQIDVAAGTGITVASDNVALTGQALALHNLATNGIFVRTGAGTVAARSVATSGTGISISNGDGVSGNPTLSLSAALSSIGGLTPAADTIGYWTGASTASSTSITAFGRSLIDDADAATARTTLGLGTMATQASNNVSITGGSIDGITLDGGTF